MAVQKARTKLKAKAKTVAAKVKPIVKAKLKAKGKTVATRAKAAAKAAVQKKPKAIPDGYPPLMPFAVLTRAAEAIEFYKNVFGATERMRMPGPEGKVAHAELGFGDSVLMLADAMAGGAPAAPARLCLYVEDVDATHQKAVAAGAQSQQEPKDQFYGDRSCRVTDPFGNEWTIMTHKEDVSPEEMQRRMAAMGPPPGGGAPPPTGEAT